MPDESLDTHPKLIFNSYGNWLSGYLPDRDRRLAAQFWPAPPIAPSDKAPLGVHIFNYDYRGHRAGIVEQDNFNDDQLQQLRDLTNHDVPASPSSNVKSC